MLQYVIHQIFFYDPFVLLEQPSWTINFPVWPLTNPQTPNPTTSRNDQHGNVNISTKPLYSLTYSTYNPLCGITCEQNSSPSMCSHFMIDRVIAIFSVQVFIDVRSFVSNKTRCSWWNERFSEGIVDDIFGIPSGIASRRNSVSDSSDIGMFRIRWYMLNINKKVILWC